MKKWLLPLCWLGICLTTAAAENVNPVRPVVFTPNKGQVLDQNGEPVPSVLAKTSVPGLDIYITEKGLTYVFLQYENDANAPAHPVFTNQRPVIVHYSRVDVDLPGSKITAAQMRFGNQQPLHDAFYRGNIKIEDIPNYNQVTIANVYPGIDWVWQANANGQPEYDFIVHAGASPQAIQMQYRYADVMPVGNSLQIVCHNGTLLEGELKAQSNKTPVEVRYGFNRATKTIAFITGTYNTATDLVIDPPIALQWSNQYGGAFAAGFRGVVADSLGNTYYTGYTTSAAFPTHYAGGASYIDSTFNGGSDVLLLKLSAANVMLWSTYLGGTGADYGNSLALDRQGNLFVTGFASTGFPTQLQSGAYYDNNIGSPGDMFVCRFDASLRLKWCTYLGGNGTDEALKIITDSYNRIYLTGYTNSGASFPQVQMGNINTVPAPVRTSAFMVQFTPGCALQWATGIGNYTGDYYGTSLAAGSNGITLAGYTNDTLFQYSNPYQHNAGGTDGFVIEFGYFNMATNAWLYGGTGNDYITDAAASDLSLLLTGRSNSTNLPMHAAPGFGYNQPANAGDYDAFIARYENDSLQWGAYYGGSGTDAGTGIAADEDGNVFLSGFTFSQNFPLDSPLYTGSFYQPVNKGNSDGFLAAFTKHGAQFWSTYKGDSCYEYPADMALTPNGNRMYVCGEGLYSCNQSGPSQSPYIGNGNGVVDGFTWAFNSPSRYCAINVDSLLPACPGSGCHGAAVLLPGASVSPFTIRWSNGATSLHNTTLCNGFNWVQVRDSAGCVAEANFNLDELNALALTSPTTCFDSGLAQVIITGGVAPYQVLWSTGDTTWYVIGPGHFIATVTDALGCARQRQFIVDTADVFNISADEVQPAHCLNDDGVAGAFSYGTPVFTNWYDTLGNLLGYADMLINLVPGIYYTDSLNCINMQVMPDTVVIHRDSTMQDVNITLQISPGKCSTGTGTITAFLDSPVNNIDFYTWSDGQITYEPDNQHELAADQLSSVTVTDWWGCTISDTGTIVTDYLEFPFDQPTGLPASCFYTADGALISGFVSSASGGPYTYEWAQPLNSVYTGVNVFGVPAGSYQLTVTDVNTGCFITNWVEVPVAGQEYLEITTWPNTCNSNGTGSLSVSMLHPPLAGGNGQYTYHWEDGDGNVYADSSAIIHLPAGYYYVTVTNSLGFSATACAHVDNELFRGFLEVGIDSLDYDCTMGTHLWLQGYVPAQNIMWSNGRSGTPDIYVADTGLITVYVQDNLCWDTASFNVTRHAGFQAGYALTPVLCYGDTAVVTVTGGNGIGPFSGDTGVHLVTAGNYTYVVRDSSGCSSTLQVNVPQPAPLVLVAQYAPIICNGGNTVITVSGSGGTSPYGGDRGPHLVNTGTYSYIITDANGCLASDTVVVTEPAVLQGAYTAAGIHCYGETATVNISATGGVAPYTGTGQQLVPAGTYAWVVTDSLGCTDTLSATFTQPAEIIPAYNVTPVACYGQTSTVTIYATGGIAPYTGTGQQVLTAGNYPVIITDSAGCHVTLNVQVTAPAALAAQMQYNAIACHGGTTQVTVSGTGGVAPYSGDTGVYTLGAGTYFAAITDSNGCTVNDTLTITEPEVLEATYTSTAINCYGGLATVNLAAAGGTGPYTGTGQQLSPAGSHTWVVTDSHGCTDTVNATFSEPAQLVGSYSATPISCFGNMAAVEVNAAGGTGYYTGTGQQLLPAGNYNLVVADSLGCTDTIPAVITQPLQLQGNYTATAIACYGDSATVEIAVSGGSGPYTGTGTQVLPAGNYIFVVEDNNGCTDTLPLTITQPDVLQASYTGGAVACFGGAATIEVAANGGISPYTGTGQQILTAGNYAFIVTDHNGCADTVEAIITQPAGLQAAYTATAISCFGGNATVDITATGGVGPYTGTGPQMLAAGSYSFTVSDNNGCIDTVEAQLPEPAQLQAAYTAGAINCFADSAVIEITATGGVTPYMGTGQQILPAGTYSFTVTDNNGCTDTVQAPITGPPALHAVYTATAIPCFGGTATIDITAAGGTAPYTGTGQQLLPAGMYNFTVADNNGCTDTIAVEITGPTALQAAYTATAINCFGDNAVIDITATGGVSPYTGTGQQLLAAGAYTLTVTDSNGCLDTLQANLTQPAALQAAYTATAINCYGDSATIIISAAGGVSPYAGTGQQILAAGIYSFQITDNNGCADTIQAEITGPAAVQAAYTAAAITCFGGSTTIEVTAAGGVSPYTGTGQQTVIAGTYTYIVTDENGCADTVEAQIAQPAALQAAYSATAVNCYGGNATINITASGGITPYTGTGAHTAAAGNYTYIISDHNGCTDTLMVQLSQPAELQAVYTATAIACYGDSATINLTANGGTSPYTGTGQQVVPAGTYSYIITDSSGCADTITMAITGPAELSLSANVTNATCYGDNGTVVLNGAGGTPGYNFPNGSGGLLPAGNYTYVIQDANGCTDTAYATLTEPAPLHIQVQLPATYRCDVDTVPVTITATGGVSPYQATGNYTLVKNTPYNWTVTDNNGCTADSGFAINIPSESITIEGPDTVCKSSNVHLTATGNYQLQWNNAIADTAYNINHIQGNTTVTVIGESTGNSCIVADTFIINVIVCTGLQEDLATDNISVYPNPNNGNFYILLRDVWAGNANMEMYAADGKLVLAQLIPPAATTVAVNCMPFAAGMYVLHITAGGHTYFHKIIIDK